MAKLDYEDQWDFEGEGNVFDSLRRALLNFVSYMRGQSNLRQSFGAIFLSIITDVLAGLFLGNLEQTLLLLPGLIVLIPGAMSMRGNIFGALGSRLGTALHMKRVESFTLKSKYIRNNIYSSITLTIFTSIALGFIARALLLMAGVKSAGVLHLVLVSFIGGIISGFILLVITFGIAFLAERKRWDPDNVTSPLITALGDFFTIPALAFSASFILGIPNFYIMLMSVLLMALAVVNLVIVFVAESSHDALVMREGSYKTIVLQSVLVMLFAGTLSALSGLLLETNLHILVTVPIILTLIPAFLEEGGNIGNILSSRLATKLHNGQLNAKLAFDHEIKHEIINSYILSLMVFPIVSVLVFIFGGALGIGGLSLPRLLFTATLAGIMLTTIVIGVSLVVSIISFKYRVDPDNVTIPIITGTADIIGVFTVLMVMNLFGVLVV
ncbi:MAG: magnesium transporter [Candidatus Aenigmarchaeota archaeon]|nr:magnesium transporter [Candidatus Aenigmarchaeota archaeon]